MVLSTKERAKKHRKKIKEGKGNITYNEWLRKQRISSRKNARPIAVMKDFGLTMKKYRILTKKCVICGFSEFVHLHHVNKKKYGNTRLVCLCPNHHEMIHKRGYTLTRLRNLKYRKVSSVGSTISVTKNGQATVTIPKALFEALGWKHGMPVQWEITGKGKLKLEELRESDKL